MSLFLGELDNDYSKFYKAKKEGKRSGEIKMRIGNYKSMTDTEKKKFEKFAELLKRHVSKIEHRDWDTQSEEWKKVNPTGVPASRLSSDQKFVSDYLKEKGFTDEDNIFSPGEFVRAYQIDLMEIGKYNFFIIPKNMSFIYSRTFYMAMNFSDIKQFTEMRHKALTHLFNLMNKHLDLLAPVDAAKKDGEKRWEFLLSKTKTRQNIGTIISKNWDKLEAIFKVALVDKPAIENMKITAYENKDSMAIWGAYCIEYEMALQTLNIRKDGLKPEQAKYIKTNYVNFVFDLFKVTPPVEVNLKIKLDNDDKNPIYGAPKTEKWFTDYKLMTKFLKALCDMTKRAAVDKNLLVVGALNKGAVRNYSAYEGVTD